jgi:hypothetical protein
MTVEVTVLTAHPRVGQAVEVRVIAIDDGTIERDCVGFSFGDDKDPFCAGAVPSCAAGPGAYGPWTPPEKHIERFEKVFSHVYEHPGAFAVSFTVRPTSGCGSPPNPYRSTGENGVEVVVEP